MKVKVTLDKMAEAINYFTKFPKRENESKNAYYRRLIVLGLDLSRTSLQYMEKAREAVNDDENLQAIINKYNELQRERNTKSKGTKKQKKAEQQKMDLDSADPKKLFTEEELDALRVRVSFELGETARAAIDGLLALVGVKLQ